jgi:hypothetical protein
MLLFDIVRVWHNSASPTENGQPRQLDGILYDLIQRGAGTALSAEGPRAKPGADPAGPP